MENLVQLLGEVDSAAGRLRSALTEGCDEQEAAPLASEYVGALSRYRDALMVGLEVTENAG